MNRPHGEPQRDAVAEIPMRLRSVDGADAGISAEFRYTTGDPYAVRATFSRVQHTPVVWVFARDLLLVGSARRAGIGDVQIYPSGDDVVLKLSSPEGAATLFAPASAIRRFNARMLGMVAHGDEGSHVDIDAELAELDRTSATRRDG